MQGLNVKFYRDIIYAIINNDQEYLKGITRGEARKILKEEFIKDLGKATGYKYNNNDIELLRVNSGSSQFPMIKFKDFYNYHHYTDYKECYIKFCPDGWVFNGIKFKY